METEKTIQKPEIFKEYLEQEKLIARLTEENKARKEKMLDDMTENEVDNVETDAGLFYIRVNKKYQFSDTVNSQEKRVKAEIEEEIKGRKEKVETLTKEIKGIEETKMKAINEIKAEEIETKIARVEETPAICFRKSK